MVSDYLRSEFFYEKSTLVGRFNVHHHPGHNRVPGLLAKKQLRARSQNPGNKNQYGFSQNDLSTAGIEIKDRDS